MIEQSSIDWLYEQFMTKNTSDFVDLYVIAKEKHKQEIIDAVCSDACLHPSIGENYYEQTFGNDNK